MTFEAEGGSPGSKGTGRMKSSEILEKAAEYIQENGWHQGASYDIYHGSYVYGFAEWIRRTHPPACSIGAIRAVVLEIRGEDDWDASYKAELILQAQIGRVGVPDFNDHPDTTAEDVILTFKKAAQAAREQGE